MIKNCKDIMESDPVNCLGLHEKDKIKSLLESIPNRAFCMRKDLHKNNSKILNWTLGNTMWWIRSLASSWWSSNQWNISKYSMH